MACAECATRALARQRRLTNRLGLGVGALLAPLFIAGVLASMAGWTAVLFPPIVVIAVVALFAVPALARRLAPMPEVPVIAAPPVAGLLPVGCEQCATSTARCTRCGAARCGDHLAAGRCADATACWQPRRRPPPAPPRQNAKTLYSTVDS